MIDELLILKRARKRYRNARSRYRYAKRHAIATEAQRAGTVKQGPVHEGAGPKDIAQ